MRVHTNAGLWGPIARRFGLVFLCEGHIEPGPTLWGSSREVITASVPEGTDKTSRRAPPSGSRRVTSWVARVCPDERDRDQDAHLGQRRSVTTVGATVSAHRRWITDNRSIIGWDAEIGR